MGREFTEPRCEKCQVWLSLWEPYFTLDGKKYCHECHEEMRGEGAAPLKQDNAQERRLN